LAGRVSVEEHIQPGYADYVLKKSNGSELLFIEAKKSGVYFALPIPHKADETHSYIPIDKLRSDANIKSAMEQVRTYCVETGCEYAAITNGHEWIFFKTFEKGKRWDRQSTLVVRGINFFVNDYTKAVNHCLTRSTGTNPCSGATGASRGQRSVSLHHISRSYLEQSSMTVLMISTIIREKCSR